MPQTLSTDPVDLPAPDPQNRSPEQNRAQSHDGGGKSLQAAGPASLPLDINNAAILLDVDGTLLDIAPTPHEVHVSEDLRRMLARIAHRLGGALAFISGRPLADIDLIFHPLKLAAVGGHGAEIRLRPEGTPYRMQTRPLDPELKRRFAEIAQIGPGILVEDKDYSLAIHYRLAPQFGGAVIKSVAAVCDAYGCDGLSILPGKSVIEIKPRGFDKGSGLQELMSSPPFAGRKPVFVGDDVTDEAAFAMLPRYSGIGISVGGIVPGASFNFDGPKDVRLWLQKLSRDADAEAR
jgi:trehalose 6-phosphate phosphatase